MLLFDFRQALVAFQEALGQAQARLRGTCLVVVDPALSYPALLVGVSLVGQGQVQVMAHLLQHSISQYLMGRALQAHPSFQLGQVAPPGQDTISQDQLGLDQQGQIQVLAQVGQAQISQY